MNQNHSIIKSRLRATIETKLQYSNVMISVRNICSMALSTTGSSHKWFGLLSLLYFKRYVLYLPSTFNLFDYIFPHSLFYIIFHLFFVAVLFRIAFRMTFQCSSLTPRACCTTQCTKKYTLSTVGYTPLQN